MAFVTQPLPPRRRIVRDHAPRYEQIHAEADKLVPRLTTDIVTAFAAARRKVPSGVWEEMMLSGDADNRHVDSIVLDVQTYLQPVIERDLSTALGKAGQITLTMLHQRRQFSMLVGSFDLNDEDALAFVRKYAGQMITGITEDVRASIRALLTQSFSARIDVRATARLLPDLIGLTGRQSSAVAKYYASLIDSGSYGADRAVQLAQDYSGRLLQQRAEVIARTETIRGANEGVNEGFAQAQEQGLLDDSAQKEWIATEDEITCPECDDLDGETVGISEQFSSGDDAPPAHPDCRCAIGLA